MGVDDQMAGTIKTFVLGPKAVHAPEASVFGLFQLYLTVYYHKATRSAEKIFTELLEGFGERRARSGGRRARCPRRADDRAAR
jgi:HD superfamily phosphohydrolase